MDAARKHVAPTDMARDEWLTLPQAQKELHVAYTTVCMMALRGEIEFVVLANQVFIRKSSIDGYRTRQSARSESPAPAGV